MTIDEGYIKYTSDWTTGPAPDPAAIKQLNTWRKKLHRARLVGHYDDLGIGYGNISIRSSNPRQFIISGTQTGHIADTGGEHYALVTDYDIDENRVSCSGPVQASSEALTHAAIYEVRPNIGAVVHVHSRLLWDRFCNRMPTTRADVSYGTPEMAREFTRLDRDSNFALTGIAVMAGHEEGIVSVGVTLEQAVRRVLRVIQDAS